MVKWKDFWREWLAFIIYGAPEESTECKIPNTTKTQVMLKLKLCSQVSYNFHLIPIKYSETRVSKVTNIENLQLLFLWFILQKYFWLYVSLLSIVFSVVSIAFPSSINMLGHVSAQYFGYKWSTVCSTQRNVSVYCDNPHVDIKETRDRTLQ